MTKLKNGLDTKKRGKGKAAPSKIPGREGEKEKQGRPGINLDQLLGDRDAILQQLSGTWERIGWRLSRATTPKAIRKAFLPMKRDPINFRLLNLLINPKTSATAVHIRRTERQLGEEIERQYELQKQHDALQRKFDESDAALSFEGTTERTAIAAEHKKRGDEFEECERQIFASDCRRRDIERTLGDFRAAFTQSELLRFKKRGYSHNPKTYANALAGLPKIGCRHSFRLCSKSDLPLWPSHHFEVFHFIECTWNSKGFEPGRSLEDHFKNMILSLPPEVPVEPEVRERYKLDFTTRDNYLRTFLRTNWVFLRAALDRVRRHRVPSSMVPYLIAGRFFKNYAKPRSAEDIVRIDIAAISG